MLSIITGILILIMDIVTKGLAKAKLAPVTTIPLWENVFHLTYVENRGIAFGLFTDARWLFVAVTLLVLVILGMIYARTKERTLWLCFGTPLVYAGAIGNLIDRVWQGYVVDFLDFRLINFPVFNVADIAVCVGAAMLFVHFFISEDLKGTTDKEGADHE